MSIGPGWQAEQQTRAEAARMAGKDYTPTQDRMADDHEEHAFGELCARCDRLFEEHDTVRRNAKGQWVHQAC